VGQACLLGGDLGSPRDEELADLRTVIHVNTLRPGPWAWDALSVHLSVETSSQCKMTVY
jgi:hypothetical protein